MKCRENLKIFVCRLLRGGAEYLAAGTDEQQTRQDMGRLLDNRF